MTVFPRNGAVLQAAIEAQIEPGVEGGLEPYLRVLAAGLHQSEPDRWSYAFVTRADHAGWLSSSLGPNQRVAARPAAVATTAPWKRALGPLRAPAGRLLRRTLRMTGRSPAEHGPSVAPLSDGFFEGLGADVVHFPYVAHYQRTSLPAVLTLHDLQHRHYPEFFSDAMLEWREAAYPAAMTHATLVAADSMFVKRDIVRQYGVPDSKVFVAPLASPLSLHARPDDATCAHVRSRFGLPARFALYPALTYGHKNHVRLIEAIARLRADGFDATVVCPGRQALHWPVIHDAIRTHQVEDLVRFPGYVTTDELLTLYRLARCLVFPSLFEGAGLPVLEALDQALPVTCSDIPPLREYAGDAASFFDPLDADAIARALRTLLTDDDLCRSLVERGARQARSFTAGAHGRGAPAPVSPGGREHRTPGEVRGSPVRSRGLR